MAGYDVHSREPAVAAAIGFATMGVLLFVILTRGPVGLPDRRGGDAGGGRRADAGAGRRSCSAARLVQLEVAGVILLVSMVGAIVIARRQVLVLIRRAGRDAGSRPWASSSWEPRDVVNTPATPTDDNPHSIPVDGTDNPRQKAYPQT